MARSTFVYVTYIRTTPEKLWSALTDDVEFMKQLLVRHALRKFVDLRDPRGRWCPATVRSATPARSSRPSHHDDW